MINCSSYSPAIWAIVGRELFQSHLMSRSRRVCSVMRKKSPKLLRWNITLFNLSTSESLTFQQPFFFAISFQVYFLNFFFFFFWILMSVLARQWNWEFFHRKETTKEKIKASLAKKKCQFCLGMCCYRATLLLSAMQRSSDKSMAKQFPLKCSCKWCCWKVQLSKASLKQGLEPHSKEKF